MDDIEKKLQRLNHLKSFLKEVEDFQRKISNENYGYCNLGATRKDIGRDIDNLRLSISILRGE